MPDLLIDHYIWHIGAQMQGKGAIHEMEKFSFLFWKYVLQCSVDN